MVQINATEMEVYSNTIAVGYAAKANTPLSEGFYFPIGEVMLNIKRMADESETVAELSRKVLVVAAEVAAEVAK